jgi:hypothetical protein
MANITVKDLVRNSIIGADLFNDLENFMRDLSEDELSLYGGCPGAGQPTTRRVPGSTHLV